VKIRFAQEIVERFHDRRAAEAALEDWNARFRDGGMPTDLEERTITVATDGTGVAQVLKSSGLVPSTSEALRMIEQRGVKVNGETVSDKALQLSAGATYVLQVGKRKFAKVTLRKAA
jgi:tyrosyl-tRNA synthetase